ncbi:MAG: ABC transporter ATP-binding protein [Flavobacteriales bacterium]
MLHFSNFNIHTAEGKALVQDFSLDVEQGEFVALIGESGSGKSLTALSIAQLQDHKLKLTGQLEWEGKNSLTLSEEELRQYRKNDWAYVFQNPMYCLNPSLSIEQQITEVFELRQVKKSAWAEDLKSVLHQVGLLEDQRIKNAYPHQLSGGQKQRVMLAIALAAKAKLLIADEPSTALDILVQEEIMQLIKSLQNEHQLAVLFITHDLHLAFRYADQIAVMAKGKLVEFGSVEHIKAEPKELYTKALLYCRPQADQYIRPLPTVEEVLENRIPTDISREKTACLSEHVRLDCQNLSFSYGDKQVLSDLSFELKTGEILGLVGASGCGKSTLAKCLMRIEEQFSGEVLLDGTSILKDKKKVYQKQVQMVFQDPYGSLDGRTKVRKQLKDIYLSHHKNVSKTDLNNTLNNTMNLVGLDNSFLDQRPLSLSGGQRQRVCIARALLTGAKLLILDESLAALDVSIQAQILNVLNDLKDKLKLSFIFISHDLASVSYFCHRILVLQDGKIVAQGTPEHLKTKSDSEYVSQLFSASGL